MPARAWRALHADRDGATKLGEAGVAVARERRGEPLADLVVVRGVAESATEESAAAERGASHVDLHTRRGDHCARRVVLEVRHLDVAACATHSGHVEREARARDELARALLRRAIEVSEIERELDRAATRRAKRDAADVAAIEDRLAAIAEDRVERGSCEVARDDGEREMRVGPERDAGGQCPQAVDERVRRERVLDRRAERDRTRQVPRERPREPRVVDAGVDRATGRGWRDVVDTQSGRETEEQGRRSLERVAASDFLRVGAAHAGPTELVRRQEPEVRGVGDDRVGGVVARRALARSEDALGALGHGLCCTRARSERGTKRQRRN